MVPYNQGGAVRARLTMLKPFGLLAQATICPQIVNPRLLITPFSVSLEIVADAFSRNLRLQNLDVLNDLE